MKPSNEFVLTQGNQLCPLLGSKPPEWFLPLLIRPPPSAMAQLLCTVLHCIALPPTVSYALQGTALQCNVLSCSAVHRFAPLSGVGAPPRIPARNLIIK